VYIQGEVGKPGRYPLTIRTCGCGFDSRGGGTEAERDAQSAGLDPISVGSPSKLSGQHEVVALAAALAGDANSNTSFAQRGRPAIRGCKRMFSTGSPPRA